MSTRKPSDHQRLSFVKNEAIGPGDPQSRPDPRNSDSFPVLRKYGWTNERDTALRPLVAAGFEPARVISERRQIELLTVSRGEVIAEITGSLRHRVEGYGDLPVIGDWVAIRSSSEPIIHHVLPRSTRLSRNVAGRRTREQVVAANIDSVLLVMGLDGDFNLRRLERLLVTAHKSGARPIVVLNKLDLCADAHSRRLAVEATASGVPTLVTSCNTGEGLDLLEEHLEARRTVALLGSSGVGKSSLINRLMGSERMRTGRVRQGDDRGRHTTTYRQLVVLPNGALLIDSPGIRELQLWSAGEDGLAGAFADIKELALGCRFRDCRHADEPDCAVRQAVEDGQLDTGRLRSYHALGAEMRAHQIRRNSAARRAAGKKAQAMYRGAKKAKQQRRRW